MTFHRDIPLWLAVCILVPGISLSPAQTTAPREDYKPVVGMPGKDAVWVPTSPAMIETMLDLAKVTPRDFVMDLGSGDGRAIIAAGKRGARGRGVEYNADLVELSKREAAAAGVADKAEFVQGDMYEADISKATVLALFLLPSNLEKLQPKFLELEPGTRIVANTFWVDGWEPDETERMEENCDNWCTAHLFIIPAKVEGTWRLPQGELTLAQDIQMVSGSLASGGNSTPIEGRLRGNQITFSGGGVEYTGRVDGNRMEGTVQSASGQGKWSATRGEESGKSGRSGESGQVAPFEPTVGQAGKDVVWVPTPLPLVEKMLDMAAVTPQDYVIDLGSGDGRNIIAAAKRGATAVGIEYNPDMVELSKKAAAAEGVGDKASFIHGDMYEADISRATVLALFLLPHNLNKLTPKFLELPPGTRIVGNTFAPEGWTADETQTIEGDCMSWCTSLLWIVPAKVEGRWRLPQGELSLDQEFQLVTGMLTNGSSHAEVKGRLRGDVLTFTAGDAEYTGRVNGSTIEGTVRTASGAAAWRAARSGA